MLIAAGVGDEARFRAVWDWTRRHLQRPDHLLAWRWADGAVVDSTPAADADLVAAGALALAGQRFGDRQLVADGRRARRRRAGPRDRDGRLVAGAAGRAMGGRGTGGQPELLRRRADVAPVRRDRRPALAARGGDVPAAARRAHRHRPVAGARLGRGRRRRQRGDGAAGTVGRRGHVGVRGRAGLRAAGRRLRRSWPGDRGTGVAVPPTPRRRARSTVRTASTVPRRRRPPTRSPWSPRRLPRTPLATDAAADELLDRASDLDRRTPTYYGAAWLAIGRLWLDTPDLGGCRRWESLAG